MTSIREIDLVRRVRMVSPALSFRVVTVALVLTLLHVAVEGLWFSVVFMSAALVFHLWSSVWAWLLKRERRRQQRIANLRRKRQRQSLYKDGPCPHCGGSGFIEVLALDMVGSTRERLRKAGWEQVKCPRGCRPK